MLVFQAYYQFLYLPSPWSPLQATVSFGMMSLMIVSFDIKCHILSPLKLATKHTGIPITSVKNRKWTVLENSAFSVNFLFH